MIEYVSATRGDFDHFKGGTPLGVTLQRFNDDPDVTARIKLKNTAGLPAIYNQAIDATDADVLVFVHDDVWLLDAFISDRIYEGLRHFDIIGICGSQFAAADTVQWGQYGPQSGSFWYKVIGSVETFGPSPAICATLDGMFLAARVDRLRQTGVRFDERFTFHMYDLDLTRSARHAGLTLGTWPITIGHDSGGNYETDAWRAARDLYLAKWEGKDA